MDGRFVVLRSTLDPAQIYEYISSLEGAQEVVTSVIDRSGAYQLVRESLGAPLSSSPFIPLTSPRHGIGREKVDGRDISYAYAWLHEVAWALIVREHPDAEQPCFAGLRLRILGIAALAVFTGFGIIIWRARRQVVIIRESETTRAQLTHAAKLASVGELAAGIAHEINNPFAAISEEAGLMKDLMDPSLGEPVPPEDLAHHLDSIQDSVFRCRDITRKLLGFVWKDTLHLKEHDIHELIDDVVDGLLGTEMLVSNIELERAYGEDVPGMITDGNQLEQVFLNIINNAVDAMEGHPGRIIIATEREGDRVLIHISDTGRGMNPSQIENIFVPFYTTKEVGKGTGLGLSVSLGIIKSLGGQIHVKSRMGKGSTFTIELPIRE